MGEELTLALVFSCRTAPDDDEGANGGQAMETDAGTPPATLPGMTGCCLCALVALCLQVLPPDYPPRSALVRSVFVQGVSKQTTHTRIRMMPLGHCAAPVKQEEEADDIEDDYDLQIALARARRLKMQQDRTMYVSVFLLFLSLLDNIRDFSSSFQ